MDFKSLVYKRRTIRKFDNKKIENQTLIELIDLARMAPSGSNMQPLKYIIVNEEENINQLFDYTKWAGYLKGEGNPNKSERPTAYIVVLNDNHIRKEGYELEAGAAIQNILLGAVEKNIGCAWLGAIDRNRIIDLLDIPKHLIIVSVIAIGYPAYDTKTEVENGSIRYYLDKKGMLHVPKRKLKDLIVLTKQHF